MFKKNKKLIAVVIIVAIIAIIVVSCVAGINNGSQKNPGHLSADEVKSDIITQICFEEGVDYTSVYNLTIGSFGPGCLDDNLDEYVYEVSGNYYLKDKYGDVIAHKRFDGSVYESTKYDNFNVFISSYDYDN